MRESCRCQQRHSRQYGLWHVRKRTGQTAKTVRPVTEIYTRFTFCPYDTPPKGWAGNLLKTQEDLQKNDARFFAGGNRVLVPKTGLNLADVAGTKQQHAQPGLTDAAANGLGQLAA